MMKIKFGREPMTDNETAVLERLMAEYGDSVSVTRRDPGETGPLVAQFTPDMSGVKHIFVIEDNEFRGI